MGRHAEWRKVAKKLRRKRIRSAIASKRDELLRKEQHKREQSPTYKSWVKEQEVMEIFRITEEERQAEERRKQWEEEEKAATVRWQEQQLRLQQAKAEKVKREILIREEWERVEKKLKVAEELRKKTEEAKKKKEEEVLAQIDAFISGQGEFPAEADISTETQPGHPVCPFFSKTGACRFKDNCSRNHIRPGISRVLLIRNFYENLGIQTLHQNEYDTDVGLEYEDSEMYQHFVEFYNDVMPEFETCGHITQFKVCSNEELHLRGNVYIEYGKERYAMKAYRMFQGRYYGGRQLSVEFCTIPSWKNAICGLYHLQRCPKGRTCNFLHVFWNPKKAFNSTHGSSYRCRSQSRNLSRSNSRIREENWNWSESSDSENECRTWRRSQSRDSKNTARSDERERKNHTDRRKDHRKRKRSSSPKREKRKSKHVSESSKKTNRTNNSDNTVSEKFNESKDMKKKSKTGSKRLSCSDHSVDSSIDDNHIQR